MLCFWFGFDLGGVHIGGWMGLGYVEARGWGSGLLGSWGCGRLCRAAGVAGMEVSELSPIYVFLSVHCIFYGLSGPATPCSMLGEVCTAQVLPSRASHARFPMRASRASLLSFTSPRFYTRAL